MFTKIEDNNDPFEMNLSQYIAKKVLLRIYQGEYVDGDRIIEEEIANKYNVSRGPVREALFMLEHMGVVERLPRRGVVVKKYTDEEILQFFNVFKEIMLISVRYSKKYWTKEHGLELKKHIKKIQLACESKNLLDYDEAMDKIFRFLIATSRNKVLLKFYNETSIILGAFSRTKLNSNNMTFTLNNLVAIEFAINQNEWDEALNHLENMLQNTIEL